MYNRYQCITTSNKCIATSNKGSTASDKKLPVTSAATGTIMYNHEQVSPSPGLLDDNDDTLFMSGEHSQKQSTQIAFVHFVEEREQSTKRNWEQAKI